MKKITLLLILMLAVVNFAKADGTEVLYKTVWTGNKAISWTSSVPGEQFYTTDLNLFTGFTNNHSIKINVATYGEPTYALRYITGDYSWNEPSNSEWSVSDGTLSYTPSEEEVDHIKARGLVLSGLNYKVTEIKIDETSVWTGTKFISWDGSVPGEQFQTSSENKDMFSSLTSDNTIKVTVSGYGDPTYTFKYRSADWQSETEITTGVTVTDGVATISVTDSNIAGAIAARGLVITGQAYFVKAISYGMDVTATTISSTPTELDWNNSKNMELSNSNKGDLANAYINDIIRVTYTTAASGDYGLQLKNPDGWGYLEEEVSGTTPTYSASEQTFDYQITKGDILQIVKNNGIILQGLNVTVTGVKLLKPEDRYDVQPVSIGADRIATYSHSKDFNLDFSKTGVSVWVATGYETGKVTLTKIEDGTTWNYQGYILKADAEGTYYPKKIDNNSGTYPGTTPGTNYLKGNVDESSIPATTIQNATTYYNYIFAKDGDDKIGFYKLTASHTLAAHRAYLSVPQDITSPDTSPEEARVSLAFDDGEITGIQSVRKQTINDNVYYTLSGQRVAQPTKGLYIVNGKKVVIK